MAAAFLLVLMVVRGVWAEISEPCQGGPTSWCQDMAMATRCHREQDCRDFWDSLALQDMAERGIVAPGKGKKCSLCTKILEQIKAIAGEDPDEEAVEAALAKGCRALGKRLGRVCKRLVKKYREKITEALQNDEEPSDTCATIGLCKA